MQFLTKFLMQFLFKDSSLENDVIWRVSKFLMQFLFKDSSLENDVIWRVSVEFLTKFLMQFLFKDSFLNNDTLNKNFFSHSFHLFPRRCPVWN